MSRRKTMDALAIIARDTGSDPRHRQRVEDERLNLQVARMIYLERTAARLTQKELAELVGTSQSAIARLEDADYAGHSLTILRRIAEALGRKLEVRFVTKRKSARRA